MGDKDEKIQSNYNIGTGSMIHESDGKSLLIETTAFERPSIFNEWMMVMLVTENLTNLETNWS